jgi:hypothetical protein
MAVFICVLLRTLMAVRLDDACPLMREALALGSACGLVYGVMWEAAWHDRKGDCGGTTELSHKAIADLCHMSKTTVLKAIDLLLDDGLIAFLHMVPTAQGSWKRRYRVMHPDHVEAQRAALGLYELPASERARRLSTAATRDVVSDCWMGTEALACAEALEC